MKILGVETKYPGSVEQQLGVVFLIVGAVIASARPQPLLFWTAETIGILLSVSGFRRAWKVILND